MIKCIGEQAKIFAVQKDDDNERLKKACADFESLFLSYILKSMRSSIPEGGFLGEDHGGKIIQSMFDENLSKEIASSGGIGVGDLLFEQLKEKVK